MNRVMSQDQILAQVGIELRHCPFCGSVHSWICSDGKVFSITCDRCNAEGPPHREMLTAIGLWNRRDHGPIGVRTINPER